MSQLKIYDSKTQQKQDFVPLDPQNIGIYVCGITVYDDCHIGHARTTLAFDVIVRYLKYRYGIKNVKFVRNITDIDDKIIRRASERGITTDQLTAQYIQSMHDDFAALGTLPADYEPRATQYIPQMINLVRQLIEKDYAYVAPNGDVYYSVRSFANYGHLAKRSLDELESGARVEVNEVKRDPLDFVLWKAGKPGEPSWESPWGNGRPGWHLECSAMSMDILGVTFDLHGGGMDLLFPHHENECAQSEAASGCQFVRNWLHVGFLQLDKEKMSKSLGNFITIKELLKDVAAEELRYFMIGSNYRSALEYSLEQIKSTRQPLETLYTALSRAQDNQAVAAENTDYEQRFISAMDDDFNTPEAIAVLFDLAKEINRSKAQVYIDSLSALLRQLSGILGLLTRDPAQALGIIDFSTLSQEHIVGDTKLQQLRNLFVQRQAARSEKDWTLADQIKQQVQSLGYIFEDRPTGTVLKRIAN